MDRIRPWLRASGIAYALLTLDPFLLGSLYSAHDAFPFRWSAFALGALAVLAAHVGTSAALFAVAPDPKGPSRGAAVALAMGGAGVALLLAIALVPSTGAAVLGLAFAGLALGALCIVPPLPLRDLGGLGEIAVFLIFGPVLVSLGYCTQSSQLSGGALLASLPIGLLTTAAGFTTHFAHAQHGADPMCPVRSLGVSQARLLAWTLPVLGFLAVVLDVKLLEYPRPCLASLAPALPMAWTLRGLDSRAGESANRRRTGWMAALVMGSGLLIVSGYLF